MGEIDPRTLRWARLSRNVGVTLLVVSAGLFALAVTGLLGGPLMLFAVDLFVGLLFPALGLTALGLAPGIRNERLRLLMIMVGAGCLLIGLGGVFGGIQELVTASP